MGEMPLKPILSNLVEAYGEIAELDDRIYYAAHGEFRKDGWWDAWHEERYPLTEGSLFVSFEHAYHHLNWASNCRNTEEEKVWHFSEEDGERWGRFPIDGLFAKLWPPPSRRKGNRKCLIGGRGKIVAEAMRPWLNEARRKLDNLMFRVSYKLGADSPFAIERPKSLKKGVEDEPFTEELFCRKMWGVYSALNTAWNSRKGRRYGSFLFSRAFLSGECNMFGVE